MEPQAETHRGAALPAASLVLDTRPEEPRDTTIDVLVLDDSDFDAMTLQRAFRGIDMPLRVSVASTISEFRTLLEERPYHLVFIDYLLPDGDGLKAQKILRDTPGNRTAPVVMISGEARLDVAVQAMKEGCLDYKPKQELDREALQDLVRRAVEAGGRLAHAGIDQALERHRQEMMGMIRQILRDELSSLTRSGTGELTGVLRSHGLILDAGDKDWSHLLEEDDRTFVFYKH